VDRKLREDRVLTGGQLLTVPEVAQRLRASEWTVREWLRLGRLKGSRPGGTRLGWRIPEPELERFIAAGSPVDRVMPPDPDTTTDHADVGRGTR
jgi:excisionase family DNA binding protein